MGGDGTLSVTTRDFAVAMDASQAATARLYRRWIGDLMRAAVDDLDDKSWRYLIGDIERIKSDRADA